MKRAIAVVFAVLFFLTAALADDLNLIKNGGFENVVSSGVPADWYTVAYRSQPGYSRMIVTDEVAHSGRYSALVENASANDARFTFTAKVKPETLYRLSGYVLVESMEDAGNGANFGVEGIYSFSDGLYDTNGEWRYLEWYGETGEDQTEVTIGIRVGGYSAESTGKAYFDDIVLEQVGILPQNVIASLWYNDYAQPASNDNGEAEENQKSTALFVLLAAVFVAVAFFVTARIGRSMEAKFVKPLFLILLAAAFVVRIVLAVNIPGYQVDISCYKAWSLRMASIGPFGFYAPDYFCDYPPGAMLLLWPVGLLMNAVGLQNDGMILLVIKLLPILCDLAGALLIWRVGQKRASESVAALIAALYLFSPAALVNGAAWGQMDSVLALLIAVTAVFAVRKDWRFAIPMFAVSALVKPQALLFAPVGLVALIYDIVQKKDQERKQTFAYTAMGIAGALAAVIAIVAPFAAGQDNPIGWLFELYGKTLGSYAYATLNTANLCYLAGANWTPLTSAVPTFLFVLPAITMGLTGAALYFPATQKTICSDRAKAGKLSVLFMTFAVILCVMALIGVNYQNFGYIMMAFAYLFAILCFTHEPQKGRLPFCMAIALIGVYVLGIKVHERYLLPALLLLLISYLYTNDRRILWLFTGFCATTFINTAIVLENSILFGASMGHLNQDTLVLNNLLAAANLILCCFAYWCAINGLKEHAPQVTQRVVRESADDPLKSYRSMLLEPKDHRLHLDWRDYLLIGTTTVLYAVLAFSHLGSTVAPQTAWVSTSEKESVVFELNEPSSFSVLYYAGVSYNDFSIAVSKDGQNWSKPYPCEMREGLCYRWNYALKTNENESGVNYPTANPSNVLWLDGKYLRIDARSAGLNLWEIVARDRNGTNLPLKVISHTDAKPQLLDESKPAENLIDEMDTCIGEPGWFTGTYFDEIYHARTAYEHLHGQAPYETTHPPLGKLMMSASIALFGMTPFGWRFAGALIGVLMLPGIYLLAMQLTHKRNIALISMLAITFDLMHFTQTRIATIDSFPVFFILLTYLFMVRYMQMDAFAVSDPQRPRLMDRAYLKTLVPLTLCGACMGLSIASKWIGIYSAAGLAILYFLTAYRHLRVNDAAWKMADSANPRIQAARSFTLTRIAITCGFCVVFFILIPCIIYCVCYIPYLAPTGPVTLKRIMRAQEGMLSYHSTPGLGMDHPFQSPWWQWPFILKPMWFAQDQFEPVGYASTILCFGNPWIFYIGAIAMAAVLLCWAGKYIRLKNGNLSILHGDGNLTYAILAVGFLAQYLPWVLVPRSMYIYHYFASVPFIILATAVLIERCTRNRRTLQNIVFVLYVLGAIVFFIMFFPYASGYLTSTGWLDAMKWFSKLYY